MILITFSPKINDQKLIDATKEYQQIWEKDGKKIVETIEKISELKFKVKLIKAKIVDGFSYSLPMLLDCNGSMEIKEAGLVHELLHRLLLDNKFILDDWETFIEKVHKIIDLILFDILSDLLGEKVAIENQELEISYGDLRYKRAWGWAMSFSKEKRALKFMDMRKKYQKI